MKTIMTKVILASTLLMGYCSDSNENSLHLTDNEQLYHNASDFNDYWYAGEAEITSYELVQARYGEKRNGQAVLIFVTEDFLPDLQVKDESSSGEGISVLKLNYTKKFYTGIYPYSMMSSVFTPVKNEDYPSTLKVSTSSQEWCGHTYLQVNHENEAYRVTGHSYFESEADQETIIVPVEPNIEYDPPVTGPAEVEEPEPNMVWTIVAGGDANLDGAKHEKSRADRAGFNYAGVWYRQNSYRTCVGKYDSNTDALEDLWEVKETLNKTSYIVRLDQWCPDPEYDGERGIYICN